MRGDVESQLERLKEQLLRPIIEKVSDHTLAREISWAATEAAALAWCTVCPVLILPLLLEEKVPVCLPDLFDQAKAARSVGSRIHIKLDVGFSVCGR